MRGMMDDAECCDDPVPLGGVIVSGTVGEVIASRDPAFAEGDIVNVHGGWQSHAVMPAASVRKVDPSLAPITTALGMPGLTGCHGLLKVGQPEAGETVFVSAASGAVGATVGQIAKIKGCRVVGCAGSDNKVAFCLDDCGFDACFNDKTCGDIGDAMRAACPKALMSTSGTRRRPDQSRSDDAAERAWPHAGLRHGLEHAPAAFNRLFGGSNFGKLVVQVSDGPTGG